MKKRMLAAYLLISGLALTAGPLAQAGQAAEAAAPSAVVRQDNVCVVNDDGVNFRGGPGTQYPVLGQVNWGQELIFRDRDGVWVMGDLVGGPTGVWIHEAYLDGDGC
ncbi:SH3 domain-containing protein [Streptomyces sp. NBC_00878]|uniref:SH3 domain-containing protein n=1 Tax=Streptomyces sp. NBC_00878 TaxID=2975854 RepID=UPI00224E5F9E|nr:SH3 domain-containing protein [Streptomyces sp. NBC_00878]MCX4904353.1 SH3 domain-containing protein [Streptomyces sp. NBC_00878]